MLNRCPGNPAHGHMIFDCIIADQTFVVPAMVYKIKVVMWGAGGGGWNAPGYPYVNNGQRSGGNGAYVEGWIAVTPGETLTIIVGQGGKFTLAGADNASYGGGGYSSSYS